MTRHAGCQATVPPSCRADKLICPISLNKEVNQEKALPQSCPLLFHSVSLQLKVMPAGRFRAKRFPDDTFLIFVALGINIITTLLGLVILSNVGRQAVYFLFLAISAVIFLLWLIGKYTFLCCTWNIRPCCADKCIESGYLSGTEGKCCYCLGSFCSKSMLYDVTVCFMALFYLTGANLEQLVCTEDSRYCPLIGQFFTWTSLILNIFITLLKASGSKPNVPSAFPVIGVLGSVYDKLLQIAAQALFIDQTVTTILHSVDIQRLAGNTTLDENTVAIQDNTAIKIMASLCCIVFFLLLAVLTFLCCANWHMCCEYKRTTVKWYECVFGEWFCAFFVVIFVILFIMGDIDWIYNFYKDTTTPGTQYRIAFLVLAFICLTVLSSYYICGLCVPGVSVALEKDEFCLPQQADKGVTVVQKMVRKQYNEWKADGSAQVNEDDELKGKITVEDHFGKANITIKINKDIKCWEAFQNFKTNLKEKVSSIMKCKGNAADAETNWTVQAYIGQGERDGIQVGGRGEAAKSDPSKDIEMEPRGVDSTVPVTLPVRHTR